MIYKRIILDDNVIKILVQKPCICLVSALGMRMSCDIKVQCIFKLNFNSLIYSLIVDNFGKG